MKDKVVVFIGDSITEGVGASSIEKCYVSQLERKYNLKKAYNCGISATRISRYDGFSEHKKDLDFNLRVQILPSNADYVVVFGGTNDFGQGLISIGNPQDYTEYTFYGALKILVDNLSRKYGKEKIRFVLPLRRFEETKEGKPPLCEWVEVMRKVLDEKGVLYLDLYKNGFEKPTSTNNEGFYIDGLHPNDQGHLRLAEYIGEFLKNNQ